MQHKIQSLRHDILTAIEEIHGFLTGQTLAILLSDRTLQLVLEREFEIIGEALFRLRNVAPDTFETIPGGHRIIGMRNILAHGYDRVDYEILWDAATLELNALRAVIERIPSGNLP
jgi:uncharacterized protein with HEPN domain